MDVLMRLFYTLIFYLAVPVILLRLLWRAWRAPAYARRGQEHFGLAPALATAKNALRGCTGSAGELRAPRPLSPALQPPADLPLATTSPTPPPSERARRAVADPVYHACPP